MNTQWLAYLVVALAAWSSTLATASAQQPSEQSLIAAWENIQKSDPKTLAFEKISDGLYHFKTTRFPFDGNLRVLNTSINDFPAGDQDALMGFVELELENLPPDFLVKHARSYNFWEQANTLYFTPATNQWLPYKELQSAFYQPTSKSWLTCVSFANYFWLILLIVIVAFLILLARKANRQMSTAIAAQEKIRADHQRVMDLSEKSVQISQDSNLVLKNILEELQRNK